MERHSRTGAGGSVGEGDFFGRIESSANRIRQCLKYCQIYCDSLLRYMRLSDNFGGRRRNHIELSIGDLIDEIAGPLADSDLSRRYAERCFNSAALSTARSETRCTMATVQLLESGSRHDLRVGI
jgi:hypothetical protein